MTASPIGRRETVARTAFRWVAVLTLANLVFNCAARWAGLGYPFTTFLWRPDDNFGDFFSLLHSYPGGGAAAVPDRIGIHGILPVRPLSLHVTSNPPVTNFHMMPLSTAIDLGLIRLFGWLDPVVLFLALFAGLLLGWAALAHRFAASRREALLWTATAALAYPMLMTLARGNLFAGLTALLLVPALLFGVARRAPVASAVLLAIACNFRPNAILFAVPLLLFFWPQRWRFAVALAATGLLVLAASLAVSTALYPAYTPAAIRAGLANYYTLYVGEGWGLAYGSSLFGVLRLLFGLRPGLDGTALAASLAILVGGAVARLRGRIDDAVLLFLAATAYCLGSTVLGDYHLLVFLVVPLAIARSADAAEPAMAPMRQAAFVAACLMLAPKNYLFVGSPDRPVSLQVIVNPLMLLGAGIIILARASSGRARPRPRLGGAGAL